MNATTIGIDLETEVRTGYNKATIAVANKLARIIWATWKYERSFDGDWSMNVGDFHDVQWHALSVSARQQDEYTVAAVLLRARH